MTKILRRSAVLSPAVDQREVSPLDLRFGCDLFVLHATRTPRFCRWREAQNQDPRR